MAGKKREFPGCTVCLIVCSLICHLCVLYGNYKTAAAMDVMGKSTAGWSTVGLGISKSLVSDLDDKMVEVTNNITGNLVQILHVQEVIDLVLTLAGNVGGDASTAEEEVKNVTGLFKHAYGKTHAETVVLLQPYALVTGNLKRGVSLRASRQHRADVNGTFWPWPGDGGDVRLVNPEVTATQSPLAPLLRELFEEMARSGVDLIKQALHSLLDKITPVLEQIGAWIVKFGHEIQSAVGEFSGTLDKVQKLFDQIMAGLNGHGSDDIMLNQTFSLFDVSDGDASNGGTITEEDLVDVSNLYAISALAGEKPKELVNKYDMDGDGQLTFVEFTQMVADPSIPNVMAIVLRTYARRLSEIGSQVSRARIRSEVALSVSNYLSLVSAKNMTKVEWIADALSNASLPQAFTADVMIQLCLNSDDPAALTGTDAGATVVSEMYRLHPSYTLGTIKLLTNTSFWAEEGFNTLDQPRCSEMITSWVMQTKTKEKMKRDKMFLLHVATITEMVGMEFDALPRITYQKAEKELHHFTLQRAEARKAKRNAIYTSATSKLLLNRLLGGSAATEGATASALPSPSERAINSGVPALPETLEFAQWLSNNATTNANIFQGYCFDYTSESSTATDTYATQLQSFMSKVQIFIGMLMNYATPSGIQQLRETFEESLDNAADEIVEAVLGQANAFINETAPKVEAEVKQAAHQAGEAIAGEVSKYIIEPMTEAVRGTIEEGLSSLTDGENTSVTDQLAEGVADSFGANVADMTTGVLGEKLGDLFETLVDQAISEAAAAVDDVKGSTSLLATSAKGTRRSPARSSKSRHSYNTGFASLTPITTTLASLNNLFPSASDTLKFARTEVSKLEETLDSTFEKFSMKGEEIFSGVAFYWRLLWTLYFFFLLPFHLLFLYYGLWASGYCGGPQPFPEKDDEQVRPQTFSEKCCLCYTCCCVGLSKCHDTQLCLWSCIILFQIVVLVIFAVSLVLCVLAVIKSFIISGCAEVYVVGDVNVCASILETLKEFLESFVVIKESENFKDVCGLNSLLTCDLINNKMGTSALITTTMSIVGTVLSLQMCIESAVLHESARNRRYMKP